MTTFNVTYEEFKKQVSSFLKKTESEHLSYEEIEAGLKCVHLHYLGINHELTEREQYEASILLELCGKKVLPHMIQ